MGRKLSRWPGRREELPTGALPPAPACLIPISLCTHGVHQEGRRNDHTVWEACGRWEVILGTVRGRKLSESHQYGKRLNAGDSGIPGDRTCPLKPLMSAPSPVPVAVPAMYLDLLPLASKKLW